MKTYHDSGWTIHTLKELMDERFSSQEKAILKAEASNERRFESVNEFRSQLKDQAATFITRYEHDILVENIKKLEKFQAQTLGSTTQGMTGRLQNNWLVGIIVSVLIMFITIIGIIITLVKH